MGVEATVDLLFLWHHHQPDYRSPRDGTALLPWVRLHATKDYLDMARRLERFPGVRAAFNFVPSLLDQLEAIGTGAPEALFDLLRRPVHALSPEERAEVVARCLAIPRYALESSPRHAALARQLGRAAHEPGPGPSDNELLALEIGFLMAWIDPMFHDRPEVSAAIARAGAPRETDRDALIALSTRLAGEVVPAYRALAERGQVELSASPYYHPILPLLVDVRVARRSRPGSALPSESFAAPEDARAQIERARARHERAFGAPPAGLWPSEGGVSPEAVALAAGAGARWLATDEAVLWASLPPERSRRARLYRPWRFATPEGEVALLFRDRDLSDAIGFVYPHWEPAQAAADFMARVRRIGRDHGGDGVPLVTVALDGENCWEHYRGDGGPFLDALYRALEEASDVRTVTPSAAIGERADAPRLESLHTGSWIDGDFHIWIGHREKNLAWDRLARTRRALTGAGITPEDAPRAWEALFAAEGSDWFWWLGDDHFTSDRTLFDHIFREHLQAAHERAGLPVPGALQAPIVRPAVVPDVGWQPLGFVHPTVDGRRTQFYEWYGAGRRRLGGGAAMHRAEGWGRKLFFGFDVEALHLRVDFADRRPPGGAFDLVLEMVTPAARRIRARGLAAGRPPVEWVDGGEGPVEGARCALESVLELSVPFAALGVRAGDAVELFLRLTRAGETVEAIPADDLVRFVVPDADYEARMWSA